MHKCKSVGCGVVITTPSLDFCMDCQKQHEGTTAEPSVAVNERQSSLSLLYPKYFKNFTGIDEVDVYTVHARFEVNDCSGCIHHASKKLLLSGVRTGNKSKYQDIKEARDTLNRWLEIYPE